MSLFFNFSRFYDHRTHIFVNLQINLFGPIYPYTFPILDKLNASSALARCIVQDEPLLKALEVGKPSCNLTYTMFTTS